MSWGLSDGECAGCCELINSEKDIDRLQKENARLKERLKWVVECVRSGSKDGELSSEVRLIADGHRDNKYKAEGEVGE